MAARLENNIEALKIRFIKQLESSKTFSEEDRSAYESLTFALATFSSSFNEEYTALIKSKLKEEVEKKDDYADLYREYLMCPQMQVSSLQTDKLFVELDKNERGVLDLSGFYRRIAGASSHDPPFHDSLFNHCLEL